MRYVLTGTISNLSVRLRGYKSWLIILLLPLITLSAIHLIPQEETAAPVQVGIALPEKGAEHFWSKLQARDDTVLTFVLTDKETIDRNVAAGRWDCGLIIADDFEAQLASLDTDRLFTLRISPGSTVYPLVRETVSACVAELISDKIAAQYLIDSEIAGEEELDALQPRLQEILPDSDRVIVTMSTLNGTKLEALSLADTGLNRILRWLVSAVLLVWLMLAAYDLGCWMDTPAAQRMGALRSATSRMASYIGADMVLASCSGSISLLLLGDGIAGCLAVAGYVLLWGTLAILLAHFRFVWTALPVMVPFAPVISLLLSSAIVDIRIVSAPLAELSKLLPVTHYLRLSNGNPNAFMLFFAVSAVFLLISVFIDIHQKRHNH